VVPVTLTAPEILLVRYGELALKGRNRSSFEQALIRNLRAAVLPLSKVRIERRQGRIAVFPERRLESVARRLQDVFGITSISPAWGAELFPDAIAKLARGVLEQTLAGWPGEGPITVRIRSSRADKSFPLHSNELDLYVAENILTSDLAGFERLKVRLKDPALTVGIDVRPERAYVFASRLPGPGGLPVGTQGKALCLLSGGIDSPVAAWMAMKRGCTAVFVTFHSYPFIGENAKKKVLDLVRVLSRYQPLSRLYVVPFAPIQLAIRDSRAPRSYRTVLYRRMMQRVTSRLAAQLDGKAIVTGESLGQVASQTIENLTCIGAASSLPVLRPLIGFDKQETIELARRIGTFDISAIQEPDCCTLFMPDRPILRGRVEACEAAEREFDVERLVADALRDVELHTLETGEPG
jgi:tRNA uracil 4-sulfurtransferase